MTLTRTDPLLPSPSPKPPAWTDATLTDLVTSIRAGLDLEALATRFARSTQAVTNRLRLLLPVEERKCPGDRVLPRLREVLADEAYDWRGALLRTPPPAPIIRHEIQGLAGLSEHHLLAFTLSAHNSPLVDEDLLDALRNECARRGLVERAQLALRNELSGGRVNASEAELTAMVDAWWGGSMRYLGRARYAGPFEGTNWY